MDSIIKLMWQDAPMEKDAINKMGEVISRDNIKIAHTPMGIFWVGKSQFTNSNGETIDLPFKICFNHMVLQDAFKSQDEAITAVEKYYTDSALAIHAQVEEFKKSIEGMPVEAVVANIEEDNSANAAV